MNIFELRDKLIQDYDSYIKSFINIRDDRIREYVDKILQAGFLWPEPLIQLNPSFELGDDIYSLVEQQILHPCCSEVFRIKSDEHDPGRPIRLYRHQSDAVRIASEGHNYVLTTGTGSGKSLAYILPITDYVLRQGSGKGIRAIIVYPMNALANSQYGELTKFLRHGFPGGKGPVTFARYTGQESDEERNEIISNPPDILLTNYVMLELILTRPSEKALVNAAQGLRFLVLDELHTYRGRQGADVGLLVRRVANRMAADKIQYIGTSATLAGTGSFDQQREQVASLATILFGAEVRPENVIGETLRRVTEDKSFSAPGFLDELRSSILRPDDFHHSDYDSFIRDPLSIWIETTFGISKEPETGRLVRVKPRSITGPEGAAIELSQLTGLEPDKCAKAIRRHLLEGYHHCDPQTGFPTFAFRLHQFISRGDTVYASLEHDSERHITMQAQQFVPGDRKRILYPLVFCRECGQEYYRVKQETDQQSGAVFLRPRDLDEQVNEDARFGYLHFSTDDPWPTDDNEAVNRLPDDWLEEHGGGLRIKASFRKYMPKRMELDSSGRVLDKGMKGITCHFIPAPFRFCLHCGVAYDGRQKNDFAKLSTLSSEGRSTATTILSLYAIKYLRDASDLQEKARKLLSFTDNRQDASLQAGHFNDFIEIGVLRSAIYRACLGAGEAGLRHEELTCKVFEALNLPIEQYAVNPDVRFHALDETKRALREVLGYRIYRDLKRGWRITSPNLEQCGLLEIKYLGLNELCNEENMWSELHPALATASPETRYKVSKTLLDLMRRELAIRVNYLERTHQESIRQMSDQYLREPWALDEDEASRMEYAAILFPRARKGGDSGENVYLSPRGGFGNYLGRVSTFPNYGGHLTLEDKSLIITQLLSALRTGGLVEKVIEATNKDDVGGYQVNASCMLWIAGDGSKAFHDPIRIPRGSERGSRTNSFFVELYKNAVSENVGLEAREHTAQVNYDERINRERRFREGRLPILFCSPTMELGVDISELNVVNMRNVPPTPANYAQRSGRAGRSGQPALVFTYCSTGSHHDQYFFKRPYEMVSGAVVMPRLDLANEDLIRAHIHAIWLAETGLSLGKSLKDILDLQDEERRLPLLPSVSDAISDVAAKERAKNRCKKVLSTMEDELRRSAWYSEGWLDEVLDQISSSFDHACDRWRTLYLSAIRQAQAQDAIIRDPNRSQSDKEQAKRLRNEAESQQSLLTDVENVVQSDFYSYRYFASEGFLPGYSFPRLPISAYIPARRQGKQCDEYLSRPRFLAISEFGPRAIVYHEGSRYVINKVIMPVADTSDHGKIAVATAKLCEACGYLHPVTADYNPDKCERCGELLGTPLCKLFRLQNVSTKRRDKINCDEEERMRLGYDIVTGVRFAEKSGSTQSQAATVVKDGVPLAAMAYGDRVTIWRINLGWRRAAENQYGFILDIERGYWAKAPTEDDTNDPTSPRTERVIPYVEDWRNCLLLEPRECLPLEVMASLEAALKVAIQAEYQLEDNELAVEPLPNRDNRRIIMFYEAAEGGAGVLRRLVEDPKAVARVARRALEICHFDPDSGEDRRRAPMAREDCEAACYDCLMSYNNQLDHKLLDRQAIRDILLQYAGANVEASPVSKSRSVHLEELKRLAQSALEKEWLEFVNRLECRLPSRAQVLIESCGTRADFVYDDYQAAVYVDGPCHEYPERVQRDRIQTEMLEDAGFTVIRFGSKEDWKEIIARYPHIFGRPQ